MEVQINNTFITIIFLICCIIFLVYAVITEHKAINNLTEELKIKKRGMPKYDLWTTLTIGDKNQCFLITEREYADNEYFYTLAPCNDNWYSGALRCNEGTLNFISMISSVQKEKIKTNGR